MWLKVTSCLKCLPRVPARRIVTSSTLNDPSVARTQPLIEPYMKAWQVHQYGSINDLALNDAVRVPPLRNPTGVLVRVRAASVNPLDIWMMNGFGATLLNCLRKIDQGSRFSMEFPLTLGRDFSGVVVETGPAVTGFKPGDEVWGATWPHGRGAHAEYCLVPESTITAKPRNLTHVEAASMPYVALTALGSLSCIANVTETTAYGKRILVVGGAGGVGSFAIQLLKLWGAEVTATCSTDAVPLVMSLGADTVIDYKTMDVDAELRASGKYDVILNTTRQPSDSFLPHLKQWTGAKYIATNSPVLPNIDSYGLPLGLLCAVGSFGNELVKAMTKGSQFRWGYFISSQDALRTVKDLVESKRIVPVIDEVFEFQRLKDAYLKVEAGHARGKTVINV